MQIELLNTTWQFERWSSRPQGTGLSPHGPIPAAGKVCHSVRLKKVPSYPTYGGKSYAKKPPLETELAIVLPKHIELSQWVFEFYSKVILNH